MKKTQITKKLMSLGMAAAMAFALVGCQKSGTQNAGSDTQAGDGTTLLEQKHLDTSVRPLCQ